MNPIADLEPEIEVINNNNNNFQNVPTFIFIEILSYLSFKDLNQVSLVSKKWNLTARGDRLCKLFCQKLFPTLCKKSWVQTYAEKSGWKAVLYLLRGIKCPSKSFFGHELHGHFSLAIEGNILAIADSRGIKVWNISNGQYMHSFPSAHDGPL